MLKILRGIILGLAGLMILVIFLVNLTPVQNFVVRKATDILSERLDTRVEIQHIRIDLLNHILIRGLYVEDHAGDTLLYAGEAESRITDWFFLRRGVPVLSYLGLEDAYVHLYRTAQSAEWNYAFIADAFDTGPKDTGVKKESSFELDLDQVRLERVRFHMNDAWVGSDLNLEAGRLLLDARTVDLKKKIIDLSRLEIGGALVHIADYPGGRPRDTVVKKTAGAIDTTAFNPGLWVVKLSRLNIDSSRFSLVVDNREPLPGEFDPEHMDIRDIALHARNIRINGDTIRGRIRHLAAKERSGFELKEFRAKVSVSPLASVCDELYIETNHSKLKKHYAMRYSRFPDFNDYINKVRMTGDLEGAVVDARDIAYFAPALRQLPPALFRISGRVDGTVAKLSGKGLDITDGTSVIKGDLDMTGLPDIDRTFIDYREGEIRTSGLSVLHYAPGLRDDPNIALEKISYAYFQGGFTGYINRFVANGVLNTNLGIVRSNLHLLLPPGNHTPEEYEGYLSSESLNIGILFRQPKLGTVSLFTNIKGKGFDPKTASLRIRARVTQLELNGYNYRNILAEGTLAKRQFDGNLLVDDPNLALAFDGSIDFSRKEQLSFNATANLLQSDLQALNLTKDSILATADFDLNCTGSNLDNFSGYAKLFNINLIRNNHRLDLDSVYIRADESSGQKVLSIESNDVTASIRGDYQLSKLAYSAQYYLHGYLPNYISAPAGEAPDQNLAFDVNTRVIDSLLAVISPQFSGFNYTTLKGSLNTATQQLTLNAGIPDGRIGNVNLSNIMITGTGDYRQLRMNADAGNVTVGDSLLNISVNVNAILGNDSLDFRITTLSPDNYGSAIINGSAYARGDSLYLHFDPSEFLLSQNRWEIPGGNRIVFARKHLEVDNLVLKSGLQYIRANTILTDTGNALRVAIRDLDLSQLSVIGNLGRHEPNGRLDGNISVTDLFGEKRISGNLNATQVKLGTDTIGDIVIAGRYNVQRNFALLEPQSGIFHKNASLKASGAFGIDSTSSARMKGHLEFTEAPLSWFNPVLEGYVSQLGGTVSGSVDLRGPASAPEITGNVTLSNAAVHVDYLGTNYTIPRADVKIDSRGIMLGDVKLLDQYKNRATLSGRIGHDHLRDFMLALSLTSEKFEVLNLKESENSAFYGHLIAKVTSMSVNGPVEDIRMNIQAVPAAASQLYLPISSGSDLGSYSYASFKTYGTAQTAVQRRNKNKFTININAVATPDLTMTMILDPATGDEINAIGTGNVSLGIGSTDDISIHGVYQIDQGDYTFTFRRLFFRRKFIINSGSKINFGGSLDKTTLDVNATYRTTARLYDLLSDMEKQSQMIPSNELTDAKSPQNVDVILFMKGSLEQPDLTFRMDLPEKRSVGTYAYTKLERINTNDRELFDQVASLLLINSFIPPEGLLGTTAWSGAINNMSDIISTTASSQLTNIVNRLLGDQSLQIELKYKNYNLSDVSSSGGLNRNEFRFGVRQNLFKDRVIVEVGSAYDWGRPNASGNATSNFNLAGDFRLQFLLTEDGRIRSSIFRTSNYDVLVDKNIFRTGAGVSWRKTFDNIEELIRSPKYIREKRETAERKPDTLSLGPDTSGREDVYSSPDGAKQE